MMIGAGGGQELDLGGDQKESGETEDGECRQGSAGGRTGVREYPQADQHSQAAGREDPSVEGPGVHDQH